MANKYAPLALPRLGDGDKALTNDRVTRRRVRKEWEYGHSRGFFVSLNFFSKTMQSPFKVKVKDRSGFVTVCTCG